MPTETHPADATPIRFRVLYADTDAQGVVYHGRFVPWLEAGRTEYLRARGYTYREMEASGVGMSVIELQIRFRAPARYDDPIVVYAWISEFSRVRVRFGYAVYHEPEARLLLEAETVHAFIDREGRLLRINRHPEVLARLQALAGTLPAE